MFVLLYCSMKRILYVEVNGSVGFTAVDQGQKFLARHHDWT